LPLISCRTCPAEIRDDAIAVKKGMSNRAAAIWIFVGQFESRKWLRAALILLTSGRSMPVRRRADGWLGFRRSGAFKQKVSRIGAAAYQCIATMGLTYRKSPLMPVDLTHRRDKRYPRKRIYVQHRRI
jgi:hypothetical protein